MDHLTDLQIAAYQRDGFVCPIDVLSVEEAHDNRAAVEALEADFDNELPEPVHSYLRLNAHFASDVPLKVALDPRVLDRVESILGPDIMLWSCEYFIKEAKTDKIVSWHQDLTYWGMDGSDHEVTAWVALSPATQQSGCMKFVPGSHRQQLVPHADTFAEDNLLSRGQEVAVDVDEAQAVHAELQPGQMSLHHGRLFHGSGPNSSDDRRIGLVMRYIRPDTPATGSHKDYAMLVRGMDRCAMRINVTPPPGSFTPAQMHLYDEITRAQTDVLSDGLPMGTQLYSKAGAMNG